LQTNADPSGTVIGNGNAGLFERVLILDGGREVSPHNAFGLFDPLEGEGATYAIPIQSSSGQRYSFNAFS
jgi:hypothetical protein